MLVITVRLFKVETALVHLQHLYIAHVTAQVIFLHTGSDTIPVSAALGDIKGVTEDNAFLRRGIFALDLRSVSAFGLTLDPLQGLLDLFGCHALVVVLEEIREGIRERLTSPGRVRHRRRGGGHHCTAQPLEKVPAVIIYVRVRSRFTVHGYGLTVRSRYSTGGNASQSVPKGALLVTVCVRYEQGPCGPGVVALLCGA